MKRKSWTKTSESRFIEALAQTSNVAASLRKARMTGADPYAQRMKSEEFRSRWDAALSEGYAEIEVQALDEARNGLPPGQERSASSERLRATLLNAHAKRVGGARETTARAVAQRDYGKQARAAVERLAAKLGIKL